MTQPLQKFLICFDGSDDLQTTQLEVEAESLGLAIEQAREDEGEIHVTSCGKA